jgi:hypothetical protein
MATASLSIRRRARSGSGSSTGLRANWFGHLSRPASQSNRSRGIDEVGSDESQGEGPGHSSRRGVSVARLHDPITISVGLLKEPTEGINNSVEFPGDMFTARRYRMATRKLRFPTGAPVEPELLRARDVGFQSSGQPRR